jgi:signal transduction histidine kinase
VAVDNARFYDGSRRQQRWSDATAELTRGLLSGVNVTAVLTVFAERIAAMAGGTAAVILLPDATRTVLSTRVACGPGAERLRDVALPVDGSVCGCSRPLSARPFRTGRLAHGRCTPRRTWGPRMWRRFGTEPGQVHGVLVVARNSGASPFDSQAVRMIIDVAAQAAVALELAARRADAEQLVVFADRDRIGRDLHDQAIQRLFAAGMTLQTVLKMTEKTAVRDRVSHVVADLDDTIKVIRSTIFALQEHESAGHSGGLRAQVLQVCQDSTDLLGFAPAVRFTGPIDYQAPEQAVEHVVAVTREALSNTARHSGAPRVAVDLETGDGLLRLRITDNGVGSSVDSRRSGLANMEDRARDLGGMFTAGPGENGGTEIRWEIPLD